MYKKSILVLVVTFWNDYELVVVELKYTTCLVLITKEIKTVYENAMFVKICFSFQFEI